ncbi:MAG: hypothetical protein IT435_05485 [Phycisphaerales bacterium]|nr:hypothetical protein [Phycisphaerales bacterium]
MSQGDRMPLELAQRVSAGLFTRWKLDPSRVFVVGSLRRARLDCGDIELLAPAAFGAGTDTLYETILTTVTNPGPPNDLFKSTPDPKDAGDRFCRAERGLKPGFLACDLAVPCWVGTPRERTVKVQIFRYTPENLGWMMIEKTGPVSFGKWFLFKWKQRHCIPTEDRRFRASIDNNLVNLDQKPVPVTSEEEAFLKCGTGFIHPTQRDAFMASAGHSD